MFRSSVGRVGGSAGRQALDRQINISRYVEGQHQGVDRIVVEVALPGDDLAPALDG
jgi:hypothetical protein